MAVIFSKYAKVAHVDYTCNRYLVCKRGRCTKSSCSFCLRDVILYNFYALMLNEIFAIFRDMVYFALREIVKSEYATSKRMRQRAEADVNTLAQKRAHLLAAHDRVKDDVVKLMFKKTQERAENGPSAAMQVVNEISSALDKQHLLYQEIETITLLMDSMRIGIENALLKEAMSERLMEKLADWQPEQSMLFLGQTALENVKNCWCLLSYMYYTYLSFNTKGQESSYFFEQYELGRKICSEHFGIEHSLTAHQFLSQVSLVVMQAIIIDSVGYRAFNKWVINKALERAFGPIKAPSVINKKSPTIIGGPRTLTDRDERVLLRLDAELNCRAKLFVPAYSWSLKASLDDAFETRTDTITRLLAFTKQELAANRAFVHNLDFVALYASCIFSRSMPEIACYEYNPKLCALFNMTGTTLFAQKSAQDSRDKQNPFECHISASARTTSAHDFNAILTRDFIEACSIKAHAHFFEAFKWNYINNIQETSEVFFLSEMHLDILRTCENISRTNNAVIDLKKRSYTADEYAKLSARLKAIFNSTAFVS